MSKPFAPACARLAAAAGFIVLALVGQGGPVTAQSSGTHAPQSVLNAPCALDYVRESRPRTDTALCVYGAVARPGLVSWRPDLTLLDVLAHAGGATPDADLDRVAVSGPGPDRSVTHIDLAAFLTGKAGIEAGRALKPGGVIRIARRRPVGSGDSLQVEDLSAPGIPARAAAPSRVELAMFGAPVTTRAAGDTGPVSGGDRSLGIQVLGAVKRPGRYAAHNGLSVLDVLGRAGGLQEDARDRKVVIVRNSPHGMVARYVNLRALASGDGPDGAADALQLEPGDSVYVPYETDGIWGPVRTGLAMGLSITSLVLLLGGL